MKITIEPTRGTYPLWYQLSDGHKFVQFVTESSYRRVIKLPEGAKILSLEDLVKEDAAA